MQSEDRSKLIEMASHELAVKVERSGSSWWVSLKSPLPWLVFVVSILLTVVAAFANHRNTNAQILQRFEAEADEFSGEITHRLAAYRSILYGFAGLLNIEGEVDREGWRQYFDTLAIDDFYPGVEGVGFARLVRQENVEKFVEGVRAQGFPNYTVEPVTGNEILGPIEIIEPSGRRNQRELGFDMFSDRVRREAMRAAWERGDITISGRVSLGRLPQQDPDDGFLMYLAYFSDFIGRSQSSANRQPVGWIYAIFRMEDLLQSVFPNLRQQLAFAVFDEVHDRENLMYQSPGWSSASGGLSSTRVIEFGHRTWQIEVRSQPAFVQGYRRLTVFILIAGLIESLSLFVLALGYKASRSDATLKAGLLRDRQTSESRINAILNSTTSALLTVDAAGNILQVNQPACELFGYSRQTMLSMKIEALIPSEYRERHEMHRARFGNDPSKRTMAQNQLVYAQSVNGELIPVEVSLSPINTQGSVHVLATIVDIRERLHDKKEKERILEQLSAKNVEMEQFVYTVSHDLKSPLVTINGFTKLLKDSLQDKLDEKQTHWLDRIAANVTSMEGLLNDLLELSRIIHRALELEDVALENAFAEVVGGLSEQIRESGAQISLELGEPVVYAHSRLVVQCLQNLISNAMQYRNRDQTCKIEVGSYRENNFTVVYVADNGIGIAPVHQQRIFEIFERLSAKSSSGSGVGLAVVKTAMEKHGGYVSVESELGRGSKFMLYFPGR